MQLCIELPFLWLHESGKKFLGMHEESFALIVRVLYPPLFTRIRREIFYLALIVCCSLKRCNCSLRPLLVSKLLRCSEGTPFVCTAYSYGSKQVPLFKDKYEERGLNAFRGSQGDRTGSLLCRVK